MIVHTGSADLVVAAASCTSGCPSNVARYDSTKSSTAVNKSTPITITYSLSSTNGFVFSDTVNMGAFTLQQVDFLQAVKMTQDFVDSPISGLMGLAGAAVAQTTTVPFWQALVADGQAAGEFGFWLSRSQTSGGIGGGFTFGGVNPLWYSGDIEFLDVTGKQGGYWTLDVSAITVQGQSVSVTTSTNLATFDTSTDIIVGPSADVAALWAKVPGSSASTSQGGFYQYPCSTAVNITVSFGGRAWAISPDDINFGPISSGSSQCFGAIISISDTGNSVPNWIFGINFLKNVYSVFRQTPAAVGFAQLSVGADGQGTPSPVPPSSTFSSTGPSLVSSSTSTASSSDSPASSTSHKKKSHTGAIAGAVVGGLVALALIAGILSFCMRRKPAYVSVSNAPPAPRAPPPLSFVADHNAPSPGPSMVARSPQLPFTATSTTTGPSSLADMKRAQAQAVPHYGDTHSAPDSIVQTPEGLHLAPGRAPASASAWQAGVSHIASPVSTVFSSRTSASAVPSMQGGADAQVLPPGARAPSAPSASLATTDPVILQELQSLRAEVHRLQFVAEGANIAPPSYHHGQAE
ncbi:aspartic peptidase domain-containing protein [Mycena pura]|uniref:Aspartic peptidase domain-containing protein n=1 Tax=Mycena pura TaxID=153505 RepID=A0AAD6YVH6_9AGAR|nr:aspartic peptidase domain-containing protein [Mycena pura]